MEFIDLKTHLAAKVYKPCYLLYGSDDYLINTAVKTLTSIVGGFEEFNVDVRDYTAPAEVMSACAALPVMSEFRVVVRTGFNAEATVLDTYFKSPNPMTVLVLTRHTQDDKKPQKLNAAIETVSCGRLQRNVATQWIIKEARRLECQIENDAAYALWERCNGYMSRISSETKKLCAYKAGGVITADDVAFTVSADIEYKIFDLSEAAAKKDAVRAVAVLEQMLRSSEESYGMFALLYKHFRRLLYMSVSGKELCCEHLKMSPYYANIMAAQAAKYSPKRLKAIVDHLGRLDSGIKQGLIGQKVAMEEFIASTILSG